ncbi:LamB/YcsF family protein [Microbacterium protaetiae]|uniref:LamB/YcsF family protein n=1 Tax=Microbacterium protaetiae TaxID=2509458 RepID=A0A4P6EDL1_9MICO|nr:5-oxoprolinase subunit PxpA [Microbacterium protaetiae]QAY60224.1 LamB/YcsF family protein [Microbacterium protaetiae]
MGAIDLNADLGETIDGLPTADDEAMFALISSASIACGAHAGDAASMHAAAARAARTGVAIGAHPSFPDRANFGRLVVRMDAADLRATVAEQLAALEGAGADIRYVKPHGALYHAAGADPEQAEAVAAAVAELSERLGRGIPVLAQGEALAAAAAAIGLPFYREAFLDRGYRADGTLVPRGEPGDLLHDPDAVAERALRLARAGDVDAVDGTVVGVDAVSFCLHGDTAASLQLARAVRAALDAAGVEVRAPW